MSKFQWRLFFFTCIKFSFLLEGIFLSPIVLIVFNKNGAIRMQYLRRRSHLVPGHCARASVRNCALFRLRCPVLNPCSHSVPSTLSGHLNIRVFHDVSKAHTFLKCTKNKHVICCLHLFDDVLPHEKIIRWQIRRRETKFCEHFYDHLPFNCLQVETEEQGFVGKITARSRGLWVKFLGTR